MNTSVLTRIPFFADLPEEELEHLAPLSQVRHFDDDEVLMREGEPGECFMAILEGEVEVIKALDTSEERRLGIRRRGEILGEMSLFSRERIRSASVRSHGGVEMLEIPLAGFEALLTRYPTLAIHLLQAMTQRMRDSESLTVHDLRIKNQALEQAYLELKAAQAQLIEQEKFEHDLAMARRIQENLLPKTEPDLPGWRLAACWQPAREVSGDFYDFIQFPQGSLGILIGDVTGKGIPAALVMATTHSVLRGVTASLVASREPVSPGILLARTNDLLCEEMPPNMFVTCLLAVLEPSSGELRFANAGHPLPYQRSSQKLRELLARGMPLGLLPEQVYEEQQSRLEPGDSLWLFSDGLVEAHNPQGEMFGLPRSARAVGWDK